MAKYSEVGKVYKKEKEPFFWTRTYIALIIICFSIGWVIGS